MKRVTDRLRQHAETYASVAGTQGRYPTPPEGYPESTGWWQDALARVRTQFLPGALRYGMPEPGRAHEWDWTQRIADELERYRETKEPGCLTEILACALGEYADRGFHLTRWEGRGDDGLKTQPRGEEKWGHTTRDLMLQGLELARVRELVGEHFRRNDANGDRPFVLVVDDTVPGRELSADRLREIHDRLKSQLAQALRPSLATPVIAKDIRLVLNGEEIGRVDNLRFDDAGKGSGELYPTSASFSAAIKELRVTSDNFCDPSPPAHVSTALQVAFRCPGCGARDATVSETKRMRCPRCGKPMQREGRPNQRRRGRRK